MVYLVPRIYFPCLGSLTVYFFPLFIVLGNTVINAPMIDPSFAQLAIDLFPIWYHKTIMFLKRHKTFEKSYIQYTVAGLEICGILVANATMFPHLLPGFSCGSKHLLPP